MLRLILTGLLGNTVLRLYGMLMYPLAYLLRNYIRSDRGGMVKYTLEHKLHWLWVVLDDSIYMETGNDSLDGNGFLSAFYWSAWRNSCVNYWNYYAVGKVAEGEPTEPPYAKMRQHEKGKRYRFKLFLGNYRYDGGWSDGNGRFELKRRKV